MIDLISHSHHTSDVATARPPGGDGGTATLVGVDRTPFGSISDPSLDARALLHLFATTGQQEPFEEVVRRYGGMVYNLCHEVTGNRHDAEDATQAAFLSLAVQVKSGQQIQAVGPWLQQVARRMSLDINRSRKRRKKREERHGEAWEARQNDVQAHGSGAGEGGHGNPASAAGWEELRHIVQAEMNELPPKYRMPLVLHYYGGLSRDEMARELNCRANTLGVRLHRGREMLAKRLAKRGVTLSPVIFGVLITEVVHSMVSHRLVSNTAEAAVLLSAGHPYACGVVAPQIVAMAHDAVRAIANAKIKFAAVIALITGGAAAAGAQVVGHVGNWHLPKVTNFDFGSVWRKIFGSPSVPRIEVNQDKPGPGAGGDNGGGGGSTGATPSPIVNLPPPRQIGFPSFGGWYSVPIPLGPSGAPVLPAPLGGQSRYVNQQPRDGFAPAPPVQTNNRVNPPGGFAGGGGGGDGGGKNNGNGKVNDGGGDVRKDRDPRSQDDVAGGKKNDSRVDPSRPDRGGVKQAPGENGGKKPGAGSGARPDTFDPGDVVTPYKPSRNPAPPVGPGVAPPPTPPGDANQGTPAPNQGAGGNGGYQSDGNLHVSNPYNPAGAESFAQVQAGGIGDASFELRAGQNLVSREVVVGELGTGVASQSGGTHTLQSLFIGVLRTGHGMYQLTGGELRVTASPSDPDAAPHGIEIGTAGEGLFLLGNATSTGKINQGGDGGGVNLTVGTLRNAKGTLRGWGTVALNGTLANNGQVVADGYGQPRTLDLSSFAAVRNDYANVTTRGWYAVNKGRLELPGIAVQAGTNGYTWGGAADDEAPSLVNGVRLTFHEVQSEGLVKIALLALDHDDVPTLPAGHHFIGVWGYDAGGVVAAGGTDLLVRYDDALASQLGLDETVLKLWKYADGAWQRLDHEASFLRDPSLHTLFVHTDLEGASLFAVSAPEPASVAMIAGGLCLWTLRRRRRGAGAA